MTQYLIAFGIVALLGVFTMIFALISIGTSIGKILILLDESLEEEGPPLSDTPPH